MPPRKPVGKRAKIWEIKTRPELLHPVLERKHKQMAADIKEQFVRIDQKYEELAKILDRKGVFGGWRPVYRAFMEELWKVTANYTGKTAEIQAAAIASKYYKYGADPEVLTEVGELFGLKEAVEAGVKPPVAPPEVIDEFIELKDTPDSYEGQGGKTVRVRSDETGLEFAETIDEFAELKDTPNTYAGQAEKFVRVRSDETGLEFAEVPPPRSPATFIVAAADSLHKKRADFVCDGVDDQEEINNAINSLPAGGGRVVLLEGTYHLTAPIKILKSNVVLEGNGWNTVLFLEDGSDCNMIEIGDYYTSLRNIKIRNIQFDGNRANQFYESYGVYIYGSSDYKIYNVSVENCYMHDILSAPVGIEWGLYCSVVNNILATSGRGVYLLYATSCIVSGNTMTDISDLGVQAYYADKLKCIKNLITAYKALDVNYSSYCIVRGNHIKTSGDGIELSDSPNSVCEGNTIDAGYDGVTIRYEGSCLISSNYITADYGIYIDYADDCECSGNILYGCTRGVNLYNSNRTSIVGNHFDYGDTGVKVYSGCENTYISGNYFNGNTVDIDDAGVGTIYAYTEDIPLMMSSDAVDASTTGAKNYEHSEQLWSAPNIYNVLQALVIIDYDWAATADGTFQLYDATNAVVLGKSSSKTGGESSRYETFSVSVPSSEASILMRANITTAGASGEQVTLHRAILRLLRSLNRHV